MTDESVPPKPPNEDDARSGAGGEAPPPESGGEGAAPPPPPTGGTSGATGQGAGAPPPPPAGGASDNRKLMLVLSYLGVLALIPYLVEQKDPEVRWHSRHGLVWLVAEVVLGIALAIVGAILTAIAPPVGCVFNLIWLAYFVGLLVLHVMGMVKALNGERLIIPNVSQYTDRLP